MSRLFSVPMINKVVATRVIHCNVAANVKMHKNLFLLNFLKFAHTQKWGSSAIGAVEPTSPAPLPTRIDCCTSDRVDGAAVISFREAATQVPPTGEGSLYGLAGLEPATRQR